MQTIDIEFTADTSKAELNITMQALSGLLVQAIRLIDKICYGDAAYTVPEKNELRMLRKVKQGTHILVKKRDS